jgi:hypothetical protein
MVVRYMAYDFTGEEDVRLFNHMDVEPPFVPRVGDTVIYNSDHFRVITGTVRKRTYSTLDRMVEIQIEISTFKAKT